MELINRNQFIASLEHPTSIEFNNKELAPVRHLDPRATFITYRSTTKYWNLTDSMSITKHNICSGYEVDVRIRLTDSRVTFRMAEYRTQLCDIIICTSITDTFSEIHRSEILLKSGSRIREQDFPLQNKEEKNELWRTHSMSSWLW